MRILAVEDDPRLLRNLSRALREEGYAVDSAENGDDGLHKASTFTVALPASTRQQSSATQDFPRESGSIHTIKVTRAVTG